MSKANSEKPSSEGCCSSCAKDGKFLLEVKLNNNWWHFKCAETKIEANRWLRWRSNKGATVRLLKNND